MSAFLANYLYFDRPDNGEWRVVWAMHKDVTDHYLATATSIASSSPWSRWRTPRSVFEEVVYAMRQEINRTIEYQSLIPLDELPGDYQIDYQHFRMEEKLCERVELELKVKPELYRDFKYLTRTSLPFTAWSAAEIVRQGFQEAFWKPRREEEHEHYIAEANKRAREIVAKPPTTSKPRRQRKKKESKGSQ
jgi:hypothetical protein